MLMMTLFTVAFAMLLVAREKALLARPKRQYSADIPDGYVDLRMTEEEWAEYEAAKSVHDNIKAGVQKGVRTRRRGKKIREGAEYSREVVEIFLKRRRNGETMDNILHTRGLTLGEFTATYDKYIQNDDERELLLGEYDEAFEDEPIDEDEMANGFDHDEPSDEGVEDDDASVGARN